MFSINLIKFGIVLLIFAAIFGAGYRYCALTYDSKKLSEIKQLQAKLNKLEKVKRDLEKKYILELDAQNAKYKRIVFRLNKKISDVQKSNSICNVDTDVVRMLNAMRLQ